MLYCRHCSQGRRKSNTLENVNTVTGGALDELAPAPCEQPGAIVRCEQIAASAGQIGRKDVESMVSCLRDPDPIVRWEASLALAESAHNLQRPQNLSQVLTMGGSEAITLSELLADMRVGLSSADPAQRASVAETLGHWPHQTAVELLEQALGDETAMVRATAARGLGQLGALESVEHLVTALQDPSLWVRRSAADALGALGDQSAAEPLAVVARQGLVLTRTAALAALGHIPGKIARDTLASCLGDADGEVRWQAARSLEAVGTLSSFPALERLLNDDFTLFDRSVREVTLGAIRAIGQREQGAWHALRLALIRLVSRLRRRP
jgi:HEAT repeat protein